MPSSIEQMNYGSLQTSPLKDLNSEEKSFNVNDENLGLKKHLMINTEEKNNEKQESVETPLFSVNLQKDLVNQGFTDYRPSEKPSERNKDTIDNLV